MSKRETYTFGGGYFDGEPEPTIEVEYESTYDVDEKYIFVDIFRVNEIDSYQFQKSFIIGLEVKLQQELNRDEEI